MTYFFFYNNLTKEELIHKLNPSDTIQDGYIYIHSLDKHCYLYSLYQNNNEAILYGKLVHFFVSLESILLKMSFMEEIKYPNKDTYIMELVDVYGKNNQIVKAYIIY